MIPGVTVKIGGEDFILPPLTLGMLETYQDKIDAFHRGEVNSGSWRTVIDIVHGALKRNYPDVARKTVADGIELRGIPGVFKALMDVSGIHATNEAGKAPAAQ